jgi:carbon storage regulator
MLVLTRKSGEGIYVGDTIRIRILEIKGGQVKIGVDAPEDKGIYRDEVYERIRQFNILASQIKDEDLGEL